MFMGMRGTTHRLKCLVFINHHSTSKSSASILTTWRPYSSRSARATTTFRAALTALPRTLTPHSLSHNQPTHRSARPHQQPPATAKLTTRNLLRPAKASATARSPCTSNTLSDKQKVMRPECKRSRGCLISLRPKACACCGLSRSSQYDDRAFRPRVHKDGGKR